MVIPYACYKERMRLAILVLMLTAAYPLWRAWLANRRTSAAHATGWLIAAWAAWCAAALFGDSGESSTDDGWRYLALSLTGCVAIAVLGARRPGVTAWNYVVLAFLAVNFLPLADGMVRGQGVQIDSFHKGCVAIAIGVGVFNYLPTRLGPAAALLALVAAEGLFAQAKPGLPIDFLAVALAPWLGYLFVSARGPSPSEFDELWRTFRDRFGMVWGLRLREQFQRAAAHAGWRLVLRWRGLKATAGLGLQAQEVAQALATLRALMKRFGSEDERWAIQAASNQKAASA